VQDIIYNNEWKSIEEGYYMEANILFRNSSNQQSLMLERMEDLLKASSCTKELSFLSVGCGCGIFDLALLERLVLAGVRVRYCGVDLNTAECVQLREELSKRFPGGEVKYQVINRVFEDSEIEEKFDIISFVQVMLYMENVVEVVNKCLSCLKPDGKIIIFNCEREGLNIPFGNAMKKLWKHDPSFADYIAKQISTMGNIHVQSSRIIAHLSITPLLEEGSGQEAARIEELMLSFLSHIDVRDLPKKDRQSLKEFYISLQCKKKQGFIPHPVSNFIITAKACSG